MRLRGISIPRPPRSWWVALAIAIAGAAAALAFSGIAEINRTHSVIESNLKFWAPEFADIFSHKDWLRLSKLGRTFAAPPVRSLVFRDAERTVFSFPLETDEYQCSLSEHHIIRQYGVTLGTLDICHDPWSVLSKAVASPLFLVTALSLFFIIGIAALFPVFSLRRGLALLVDHLAEWSKSTSTADSFTVTPHQITTQNSLEAKLHALAQDLVKRRLESERKSLRDQIVHDVAHNVGSPVATLAIRVNNLEGISPEARTSILDGLDQISGLLAQLKAAAHSTSKKPKTQPRMTVSSGLRTEMISTLLSSIVEDKLLEKSDRSEVRLQYEPCPAGYGAFCSINALDFRVILSNVLNNAFDAVHSSGVISVGLEVTDSVKITVMDTGCGIPAQILRELFQEGFSYGKTSGSGRGLFHAKNALSAWGGSISIESEPGRGAAVKLELPKASPPSWFLAELDVREPDQIVVLDDDPSISTFWRAQTRFQKLISFSDPVSFSVWLSAQSTSHDREAVRRLFLIDLRLGADLPSGLDLIERHGLADSAVLVTSDAGLESVRSRCSFLGAKLLWKQEIGCIPIKGGNERPGFSSTSRLQETPYFGHGAGV